MKIEPRFGFVVAYVDDMEAARRFYTTTLGLTVQREAPNFIQFEHFALASDESMNGRRELEVYWLVDDIQLVVKELGVDAPISMPLRELPFGKVIGVRDPSGQPRYLLEMSKSRPSRPAGEH